MTNQPGRVRIQHEAGSERSWGYRTDARLQWMMTNLASLDAPVWQVMMVLIKYADESGRTFPAVRTIGDSLDIDPVDVEVALADAEALDLIRHDGLSEYGTPAWMLQEGRCLPDPLPLFTKVVINKVRDLLRYIGPIEYILLEAMIDIGYKWMDNTIHTTSRQLRERLPGLDESQLRDALHRLCATSYVTRLEKGYGDRPSIFRLEISAVAEAARRRIPYRTDNLGPGQLSGNNKVAGGQLSGNNSSSNAIYRHLYSGHFCLLWTTPNPSSRALTPDPALSQPQLSREYRFGAVSLVGNQCAGCVPAIRLSEAHRRRDDVWPGCQLFTEPAWVSPSHLRQRIAQVHGLGHEGILKSGGCSLRIVRAAAGNSPQSGRERQSASVWADAARR